MPCPPERHRAQQQAWPCSGVRNGHKGDTRNWQMMLRRHMPPLCMRAPALHQMLKAHPAKRGVHPVKAAADRIALDRGQWKAYTHSGSLSLPGLLGEGRLGSNWIKLTALVEQCPGSRCQEDQGLFWKPAAWEKEAAAPQPQPQHLPHCPLG